MNRFHTLLLISTCAATARYLDFAETSPSRVDRPHVRSDGGTVTAVQWLARPLQLLSNFFASTTHQQKYPDTKVLRNFCPHYLVPLIFTVNYWGQNCVVVHSV